MYLLHVGVVLVDAVELLPALYADALRFVQVSIHVALEVIIRGKAHLADLALELVILFVDVSNVLQEDVLAEERLPADVASAVPDALVDQHVRLQVVLGSEELSAHVALAVVVDLRGLVQHDVLRGAGVGVQLLLGLEGGITVRTRENLRRFLLNCVPVLR